MVRSVNKYLTPCALVPVCKYQKDIINTNIEFIKKYIKITALIKIYKNGILGLNKDNNLIYLNFDLNSFKEIKLDYNSFSYDCFKINYNENICLIFTNKDILVFDLNNFMIKTKFNYSNIKYLSNFIYYKKGDLLGFKDNKLIFFNIYNKVTTVLLNNIEKRFYNFKNIINDIFYFFSNKILYTYDISKKILLKKNTHYINVDQYGIFDLNVDTYIVTSGVHTCVCIYGINNDRTKCFMGHFYPSFKDIESVIKNIKNKLGNSYNDMKIRILGGNNNNLSYNYFQNVLLPSNHEYNILEHTLKIYNIIISKNKTLII